MKTKICSCCKETKTAFEFGVNRSRKDGLQSWCKACRIAANNRRHFERMREDPEFREKRNADRRRTGKAGPKTKARLEFRKNRRIVGTKDWARHLVVMAVYKGNLDKPSTCETCGLMVDDPRLLQGHHWHGDYANRPLEVRWLCSLCHGAEHAVKSKAS